MDILLQEGRFVQFVIDMKVDPYFIEFSVYEVISWNMDYSVSEKELYLKGSIKWDGCSHVWFGDEDNYLHLCGKDTWLNHCKVMVAIYALAEESIEKYDKEVAE